MYILYEKLKKKEHLLALSILTTFILGLGLGIEIFQRDSFKHVCAQSPVHLRQGCNENHTFHQVKKLYTVVKR